MKVLFVCTGNICRSPTAEGIFRHRIEALGLAGRIAADSAGISSEESGNPPDPRAARAARARGSCCRSVARTASARPISSSST